MLIADGLGGRTTDYKGKTCLEAADTPNLNKLTKKSAVGLLDPIKPGVRPGSDTAHLSLFGYDPYKYYTGRGVFEALGSGIELNEGDVSFRTNFGTVDENFVVKDRRAGRIQEGQEHLQEALQELKIEDRDIEIDFKTSVEHRGALVLRGPGLSDSITDVDPHETGKKISESKPMDNEESSEKTAEIVNEVVKQSYEILKDLPINKRRKEEGKLPANVLLTRGAALTSKLPTLEDLYGVEGIVIAGGALYMGIGKAIGLDIKKAKGVTGGADSPIINKAKLAVKEMNEGTDFVFLHMKGADSCAHDHDAEEKIRYIEKVDGVIEYLLDNLDLNKTHITFTGDHTTPIDYGDHVPDPVPILFAGPHVIRDKVKKLDERNAQEGGIGRISGNVAPILFGYSNWLEKFGA